MIEKRLKRFIIKKKKRKKCSEFSSRRGSKRGIAVEDAKKDTRVPLISWIIHKF